MSNKPFLTLSLCAATIFLYVLPEAYRSALVFDLDQLQSGNILGLVFGHWLHADINHLVWNVSALALLGGLLEHESRGLLAACLLTGIVFVDLLLLSPLGTVERYCGLSGVLNTVLAGLLYTQWQRTHSMIVPLVACLALVKIGMEMSLQQSIFTDISWPPYAPAHLAGMLGAGVMAVILHHYNRFTATRIRSDA